MDKGSVVSSNRKRTERRKEILTYEKRTPSDDGVGYDTMGEKPKNRRTIRGGGWGNSSALQTRKNGGEGGVSKRRTQISERL